MSTLESKETSSQGWVPGVSLAEELKSGKSFSPLPWAEAARRGGLAVHFYCACLLWESLELERLSDQTCCAVRKVNGPRHSVQTGGIHCAQRKRLLLFLEVKAQHRAKPV